MARWHKHDFTFINIFHSYSMMPRVSPIFLYSARNSLIINSRSNACAPCPDLWSTHRIEEIDNDDDNAMQKLQWYA